jgi:hypothetical protein
MDKPLSYARSQPNLQRLHTSFLAILPRIVIHGRIFFRFVKCPVKKEDFLAEMLALAWKWYVNLAARGKDGSQFVSALARFAARAVKCGRRLCGQEKTKDVLSLLAQCRRGFCVESLPVAPRTAHESLYSTPGGQRMQDLVEDRLKDNRLTPVPDQVAFRIDFPGWLQTLTGRERHMVAAMLRNEDTKALSKQFEVSEARISQLRRELHDDWIRFCDERGQPDQRVVA